MLSAPQLNVILHIGTEKTGSTTLQWTLKNNQAVLLSQGILYLTISGLMNARALAAAVRENHRDAFLRRVGLHGRDAHLSYRHEITRDVEAAVVNAATHGIHTVVISSEHFHSQLRRESEVARLRQLLTPHAKSIRIVCYLRRQVDLLASFYSTRLKNGRAETLQELAQAACRPSNPYYNYAELFDRWANQFGHNALTPRHFSPNEWKDGDLLTDFISCSGLLEAVPELRLKPVAPRNESVSLEGQALLLAINKRAAALSREDAAGREWLRLRVQIARAFAGKGETLQRDEAEAYQMQFSASNELVRRQWFPERRQLFESIPKTYGLPAATLQRLEALRNTILPVQRDESCRDPVTTLERCIALLRNSRFDREAEKAEEVAKRLVAGPNPMKSNA